MANRTQTTLWTLLMVEVTSALAGCGKSSPTSPTQSAVNVSGSWDAMFRGTIVQRNDGGPIGAPQTDNIGVSLQQSGTSVSGVLIYSEGRPSEFRVPITGTLTGTRLEYQVDTSIGGCALSIRADTTVAPTANSFSGTQTQSNCEGRADGTVTGSKR
jgi:hypothetical protein